MPIMFELLWSYVMTYCVINLLFNIHYRSGYEFQLLIKTNIWNIDLTIKLEKKSNLKIITKKVRSCMPLKHFFLLLQMGLNVFCKQYYPFQNKH